MYLKCRVSEMENGRSRGSRRTVVAFVLVIVLVAGVIGAVYYGTSRTTSTSSTSGSSSTTSSSQSGVTVLVFGIVGTSGNGTYPTALNFTSLRTHAQFVAHVSSNHFSISLPNDDTYNVTMSWGGNYTWQQGMVSAGTFTVNMTGTSNLGESYNIVLPTPNSLVTVSGVFQWGMVTSQPTTIRFTATDGENFTAPVAPGNSFSLRLPNMMNYQVYVETQNSTGYQDWYSEHTLDVRASVDVVGLVVTVGF